MDLFRAESRIFVSQDGWFPGYTLRISFRDVNQDVKVVTYDSKDIPENEFISLDQPNELLRINAVTAQSLINQLWNAGLRPTDSVDAPGELKAVQAHLADLKKQNDQMFEFVMDTSKFVMDTAKGVYVPGEVLVARSSEDGKD